MSDMTQMQLTLLDFLNVQLLYPQNETVILLIHSCLIVIHACDK